MSGAVFTPYTRLWQAQGQLYIYVLRNLNRHVGADDNVGLKTTDMRISSFSLRCR